MFSNKRALRSSEGVIDKVPFEDCSELFKHRATCCQECSLKVLKSPIPPPLKSDPFEAMSNSQFSNQYYSDQIICHPLQILPNVMFQPSKSQSTSGFHHSSNLMMGSSQKVDSVYVPESISPWSEIITKYLNGTAPSQRKHYKSRSSYHSHHNHHHSYQQQQQQHLVHHHHSHHLPQKQQPKPYDQMQQMLQIKSSGTTLDMGQANWDKLEGINAYPVQQNPPVKAMGSTEQPCFSSPYPPSVSKNSFVAPKQTPNMDNAYQGTSSISFSSCPPSQPSSFVPKTSSIPTFLDQRSLVAPNQLNQSSSIPTPTSSSASNSVAIPASVALNMPSKPGELDSISEMTNVNRFTIEYESIQEPEENYKDLVEREWQQSRGPQSGPSDSMMNGMIRELLNSTHEDDGSIGESFSVATHFSNDDEIADLNTVNVLCQR